MSRVVVQGFHEVSTGAAKAAPVAFHESVHLLVAHAATTVSFPDKLISGRHFCTPEFHRRRMLSTSYHTTISSVIQNKQSGCGNLRRGFMVCLFLLADGTAHCIFFS